MKKEWIILLIIFFIASISASCNSTQIDINTATKEKLMEIKWIGDKTADKIIVYRQDNLFNSVDELINISGIGEIKLAEIKAQGLACVNGETNGNDNANEDTEGQEEDAMGSDEEQEKADDEENEELVKNLAENKSNQQKIIILDAQTIKSLDAKEKVKGSYAIYGLIAFCLLIALLFLTRKKKYKTEFET